jgi:hypothetical protein
MPEIPHAVLSEQFQQMMRGRRLVSAVFLTFAFEPDFFEQEILPAILPDTPLSHVPAIRLLQLEEVLKTGVNHVAVYYDRDAMQPIAQSPKLDVRRIPINNRNGSFHPKNVFLLTEDATPGSAGPPTRTLCVAALSANLTRAGWWENVEVCHIEMIPEGGLIGCRTDLLDLIRRVRAAAHAETEHEALEEIRRFVSRCQQRTRLLQDGVLFPRLYTGGRSVTAFLAEVAGPRLTGLHLEVISPYFDRTEAKPLQELIDQFSPREVRVFLPRADDGGALCEDTAFDSVQALGAHWARLPSEIARPGKQKDQVKRRRVHAKVYRFFSRTRRYEAFLVGSVNLTSAAHSGRNNFETAFFVETEPKRTPEWWLDVESKKPTLFLGGESEETPGATTALSIRFDWSRETASAFWDADSSPGDLRVSAQGAPLFRVEALPPREWKALPKPDSAALKFILTSTSLLEVAEDDGELAVILVQEEGMAHKPSIRESLTVADILRYWALLTPEQRAQFLDDHAADLPDALVEQGIEVQPLLHTNTSLFDSFAGYFHAFNALERHVLDALEAGRPKEAEYRLLGKKFDSLPSLLGRLLEREKSHEPVDQYVIALCARQLLQRVESEAPGFRDAHRAKFKELKGRIARAEAARDRLEFGTPEERSSFLDWFEQWFLKRAEPMAGVQ